jgi:hypothetical protein
MEGDDDEAGSLQQELQRIAHRIIVIDHRDVPVGPVLHLACSIVPAGQGLWVRLGAICDGRKGIALT